MPRRDRGAAATSQSGKIEISRGAIAAIVRDAVRQSYGVVGMAPVSFSRSLARYIRQDDPQRGIEIEVTGDQIVITLHVVLEYGLRISEVAHNLMDNVKFAVEHALGMPVQAVNVHVQALHFSPE
ncbi:MAG: Asp23/Gls24 family envelope stress response protein [Thermomicrobiales bacterium]|jgi:uncharacterized alkaline shock family protein YloU|nr:Asp23/Gls24 family envelope stress response protein [Thermomicrobiales bacterium]